MSELTHLIPDFKKIWKQSNLKQKIKFVKEAKLNHILKINQDTQDYPKWTDFESHHQQSLREGIRRLIE